MYPVLPLDQLRPVDPRPGHHLAEPEANYGEELNLPRPLGQHFLNRRSVLERIAWAACPEREPLVVEIGPGRGALTRFLLERAERIVAIELDAELAAALPERFPALEIVEADVLKTDLGQWGPAVVVGNLPYYITSPILEAVCGLGSKLRRGVFLVQKEVAERVAAGPGGRDYGYLSVAVQVFTKVEMLFTVPPAAFSPPPKVDSAVLKLEPREPAVPDPAPFLQFVSLCFRQKRKTLRNNLRAAYPAISELPEAGLRAEQLSLEQIVDIYGRLGRAPSRSRLG